MSNHVTKETAIMLKEKGYDRRCMDFYDEDGLNLDGLVNVDHNSMHHDECYYSAPTISDALEWLREVKGLHVYCDITDIDEQGWYWVLSDIKDRDTITTSGRRSQFFDTHDLAAEAGLIAGLEWMGKEGDGL